MFGWLVRGGKESLMLAQTAACQKRKCKPKLNYMKTIPAIVALLSVALSLTADVNPETLESPDDSGKLADAYGPGSGDRFDARLELTEPIIGQVEFRFYCSYIKDFGTKREKPAFGRVGSIGSLEHSNGNTKTISNSSGRSVAKVAAYLHKGGKWVQTAIAIDHKKKRYYTVSENDKVVFLYLPGWN